jgi:hypothetical protein
MAKKTKRPTKNKTYYRNQCVAYILDFDDKEHDDFINHCRDNHQSPIDGLADIAHIYADAMLARYSGKQLKEVIAELQKEVDGEEEVAEG